MNSLANKALPRALGRALSAPTEKQGARPEPVPDLVITVPINRVMQLEGKRYAMDFVRGLGAAIRREPVRTKAIPGLTRLGLCGQVAVLPGWEISKGARLEVHIAREPGMKVVNDHDLVSMEIAG
ncbi:hypothetical protein PS619_00217 [Pseudomonas fluorescens]|nr:hypothetical protein PS619_00217 [Pseudomonas fluorescens]